MTTRTTADDQACLEAAVAGLRRAAGAQAPGGGPPATPGAGPQPPGWAGGAPHWPEGGLGGGTEGWPGAGGPPQPPGATGGDAGTSQCGGCDGSGSGRGNGAPTGRCLRHGCGRRGRARGRPRCGDVPVRDRGLIGRRRGRNVGSRRNLGARAAGRAPRAKRRPPQARSGSSSGGRRLSGRSAPVHRWTSRPPVWTCVASPFSGVEEASVTSATRSGARCMPSARRRRSGLQSCAVAG